MTKNPIEGRTAELSNGTTLEILRIERWNSIEMVTPSPVESFSMELWHWVAVVSVEGPLPDDPEADDIDTDEINEALRGIGVDIREDRHGAGSYVDREDLRLFPPSNPRTLIIRQSGGVRKATA